MSQTYNVYCDESCHLEHDPHEVMVLGAVWCPLERTRKISVRIREIKAKHGLKPGFEIKWTKVSQSKAGFYRDILDYFFDEENLHLRALIIREKSKLNHQEFEQDHDTWYYKMYFEMLKVILDPEARFRIYLDIKDTLGGTKISRLRKILSHSMYDFSQEIIERIQLVRSEELEVLQLADLLIGAISYRNRGHGKNPGKLALVRRMMERSGYSLARSTLLKEKKVNLFVWSPR